MVEIAALNSNCHPELYNANRHSEVRTSEPVCRVDSESHS